MQTHFLKSIFGAALALIAFPATAAVGAPEPLTRVADVRALSREDAGKSLLVKLRATVVYKTRGGRTFIVNDGAQGISVHLFRATELGIWQGGRVRESDTEVGAVIEIEGVTGPAGYSPVIVPTRFRRVGTGPVVEARRVPMESLISGSEVTQRVLVEGIVQRSEPVENGRWAMRLIVEGHPCEVDFQMAGNFDAARTLDARVQVRGFSSPVFNLRSESTLMRLNAWDEHDVTILEPPPADPFAAHHLPLNGLLPFSKTPDRFRRKLTTGSVNFAWPGRFFFLQDGDAGLLVKSTATDLQVGDRVEAAGFVDITDGVASLTDAVTRKIGRVEPPRPVVFSAKELLLPEIAGRVEPVVNVDHFGCLVAIHGTLRQIERRSREGMWSLLVDSGGETFRAQLRMPIVTWQPPWQVGAELDLRGVCELEFSPRQPGKNSPVVSGFTLWLRDPADVTITKDASWWTPQRLGLALGGTGVVLALALGWNLLLRRKVDAQMAVISSKLRSETLHTERNRLARDLHDSLEQQLVGVSLQLDDAELMIEHDPQAAVGVVTLARRMLRHTRDEARRSVWDLRSELLESDGLGKALEGLAEGLASPSGPLVVVSLGASYHAFPLDTEFQMFRIAQEAVTNALKHAAATRITISLDDQPDATRLVVVDDGRGFSTGTPARSDGHHFGLLGMHERADRIGAELTFSRNPQGGTTVTLSLPHHSSANTENPPS